MKINKIRPKFHFLTKIEIKKTHLVFLFCYLLLVSLLLVPFGTSIKRLLNGSWSKVNSSKITKQKHSVSYFYFYFCQKMELRTYFVYFRTFSYKFKVKRTPTESGWYSQSETKIEPDLRLLNHGAIQSRKEFIVQFMEKKNRNLLSSQFS